MRNSTKLIILLFILIPLLNSCYPVCNKISFPVDPKTQRVTFTASGTIDNVDRDELFRRANVWFARAFVDPKSTIKYSDKQLGFIIGKAYLDLDNLGAISYNIDFKIRDNKYLITVRDIYHIPTKGVPSQGYFNEKAKKRQTDPYYRNCIMNKANDHITSFLSGAQRTLATEEFNL